MAHQCTHRFPLPPWMGEDQDEPCRCDLPWGHEGAHSCSHLRDTGQVVVELQDVPQEESDIKLAGDALELIRRTQVFTDSHPTGPLMEAHDALRAFIHGGQVNQ